MDKVVERVRGWRDELLNLSRRDRVLYYRPTKTASVQVIEPKPLEVLAGLRKGKGRSGWQFFYPPEEPVAEFGEDEPRLLTPRQSDELLTQKTDRKSLEAALRTLDRRTTQEFMDKGIWVLYLAVGFLEWVDPENQETVRSPLVLVPVNLLKASPRDPVRVVLADEDAVVNPALAVRIEGDFGLRLPPLPDIDELDLEVFLDEVAELVRKRGWHVSVDAVIDVFSFHKEAMYRDLKENEKEICANDVIRALALGADADVDLSFVPPDEDDLDERHPPEELATIRDADASQRRCIVASRAGHSFVMDGPPGTGKSQTISNMIAQALFDGKTVLFVSEKIAALEVVKARLDDVGLGEYLLELHSHKATRREVAQTLYRSLHQYPQPKAEFRSSDAARLVSSRRELSSYAAAMNETRQRLGISLHRAIGRLSQLESALDGPLSAYQPAGLDADVLNQVMAEANALSRAWGPVQRGDGFLWRGVKPDFSTVGGKRTALHRLEEAVGNLRALETTTTEIAEALELWWNEAPSQVEAILSVMALLSERRQVPVAWLTAEDLSPITMRLGHIRTEAETHSGLAELLAAKAGPLWRGISPDASASMSASRESLANLPLRWPIDGQADVGRAHDAFRFAKASVVELGDLHRLGEDLASRLGVRFDSLTLTECGVLTELASMSGLVNQPEADWLDSVALTRVSEAAGVLGPVVGQYRSRAEGLKAVFKPSVLDLDLHALKVRFDTLHKGVRKLGGRYRADKKLLAGHTISGKVTKQSIAALGDAVEWKEIADHLAREEQRYEGRIGDFYYRGAETRFDEVSEAIAVAARVTELASSILVDQDRLKAQFGRGDRWDPEAKRIGESLAAGIQDWLSRANDALLDLGEITDTPLLSLGDDIEESIPHLSALWNTAHEIEESVDRTLLIGEVTEIAVARAEVSSIETNLSSTFLADRELLGDSYRGLDSAWDGLAKDIEWADAVRQVTDGPVDETTASRFLEVAVRPDQLENAAKEWISSRNAVEDLFVGDRGAEVISELEAHYGEALALLGSLEQSTGEIDEWVAHVNASNALAELGLGDAVAFAAERGIGSEQLSDVMERATLETWVDWVIEQDDRLDRVRSVDRDALVGEFQRLDKRMVDASAASVMSRVNSRRPQTTLGPAGLISREGMRKSRHMPVRDLLSQTFAITQVIKPCFMMSPLSVSQFLTSDLRFDLVVFDEASQVRPSDAANCIYRGHQLVVAGDQKQLPPTDFFQRMSLDGDDEYQEDELASFESVLDLCKAGGLESLPLRWHYRSQHESLITFSNYSFYEGALITYPGALDKSPDVGIELFEVDGVYRRGAARDNLAEAELVAERVIFHATHHPRLTLGVVAFSEAQASTIEYVLDQKRSTHPELDDYFTDDRLSGFFVKNLENVQGDERDLMIFSVGYGPDENGKLTMNFGPLNRPNGWRRLNVAITRARRRVEVVASIRPEDFQTTIHDGPRHLQRYLDFARRGIAALALDLSDSEGDAESPFEEEVLRVIRSWGYEARPQVGVASYRIDVGVVDPASPGRYILGVECDGAMYHSSRVARDRDRLRQQVLEGLDWRIHRIWGTAWYRDRRAEEERLRDAIEGAAGGARRRAPRPTAPISVELVTADFDTAPSWTADYEVHRPMVPGYREMQDPGSIPAISEAIQAVVAAEGPIAQEVALKRVREAWGLGRAGSVVRGAFATGLGHARRGGVRKDRRNFLWTLDQMSALEHDLAIVVRRPTNDPDSRRDVTEIAAEERRSAIVHLVVDARRVTVEELTSAVSGLFGWNRRGSQIAEQLDKDIRSLIRQDRLRRNGNYLGAP